MKNFIYITILLSILLGTIGFANNCTFKAGDILQDQSIVFENEKGICKVISPEISEGKSLWWGCVNSLNSKTNDKDGKNNTLKITQTCNGTTDPQKAKNSNSQLIAAKYCNQKLGVDWYLPAITELKLASTYLKTNKYLSSTEVDDKTAKGIDIAKNIVNYGKHENDINVRCARIVTPADKLATQTPAPAAKSNCKFKKGDKLQDESVVFDEVDCKAMAPPSSDGLNLWWGCYGKNIEKTDADNGINNTDIIVANCLETADGGKSGLKEANSTFIAARYCKNLAGGWYLPSQNELNKAILTNNTQLNQKSYWSSTQSGMNQAAGTNKSIINQSHHKHAPGVDVRCARLVTANDKLAPPAPKSNCKFKKGDKLQDESVVFDEVDCKAMAPPSSDGVNLWWGCYGKHIYDKNIGITDPNSITDPNNGIKNTGIIVANCPETEPVGGKSGLPTASSNFIAARYCKNLHTINQKLVGDWYLPAQNELNQALLTNTQLDQKAYWSSTQMGINEAIGTNKSKINYSHHKHGGNINARCARLVTANDKLAPPAPKSNCKFKKGDKLQDGSVVFDEVDCKAMAPPSSDGVNLWWGCYGKNIEKTDADNGIKNTDTIVANCPETEPVGGKSGLKEANSTFIAARYCKNLNSTDSTLVGDWYLPAQNELNLALLTNNTQLNQKSYWSSTQSGMNQAAGTNKSIINQSHHKHAPGVDVRCARLVTANDKLYRGCAEHGKGDTYKGGILYSKNEEGTICKIYNKNAITTDLWGCNDTNIVTDNIDGKENTRKIIAKCEGNSAAKYCNASGWYLPAKDELSEIFNYNQFTKWDIGVYFSSSEYDGSYSEDIDNNKVDRTNHIWGFYKNDKSGIDYVKKGSRNKIICAKKVN